MTSRFLETAMMIMFLLVLHNGRIMATAATTAVTEAQLSEEQATSIAAAWSKAFTQFSLGGDPGPFADLFADEAKFTTFGKTLTVTKGEADPSNGIVSFATMQEKTVPEMEKVDYKQTIMSVKGLPAAANFPRRPRRR